VRDEDLEGGHSLFQGTFQYLYGQTKVYHRKL